MSEKLEQVAVDAAKDLLSNLTQAKAFVLEQAPDVLREMVLAARIESSLWMVFWVVCFGGGFWMAYKAEKSGEWPPKIPSLIYGALSVIMLVLTSIPLHIFITSWFAPKVYLVENLTKLIGGN